MSAPPLFSRLPSPACLSPWQARTAMGCHRRSFQRARKLGGKVKTAPSPAEAVKDAHVIATDTWVSMGDEKEREKRLAAFHGFTVNDDLLRHAAPDARVLHCLPAHRGEEITGDVLDGPAEPRVGRSGEPAPCPESAAGKTPQKITITGAAASRLTEDYSPINLRTSSIIYFWTCSATSRRARNARSSRSSPSMLAKLSICLRSTTSTSNFFAISRIMERGYPGGNQDIKEFFFGDCAFLVLIGILAGLT